jgi:hypothetical protein
MSRYRIANACPPSRWSGAGGDNQVKEFKHKGSLEFIRFFVHILSFLGSAPCVTKEKWKKGKREKQKALWVFFPFSPLSPFSSVLHMMVLWL